MMKITAFTLFLLLFSFKAFAQTEIGDLSPKDAKHAVQFLSLDVAAIRSELNSLGGTESEKAGKNKGMKIITFTDGSNRRGLLVKDGKLAGIYVYVSTSEDYPWGDIEWELKKDSSFKRAESDNANGCGYTAYSNGKVLFRFLKTSLWVTNLQMVKNDNEMVDNFAVLCD